MCGRFVQAVPGEVIGELFGVAALKAYPARYNLAPSQNALVVRETPAGRELAWVRWGLVPSWAKEAAIGSRLINARIETAADKPAFRQALARRRCLIPVSGFYEWHAVAGRKRPYFISFDDRPCFALGGLWESWNGGGGVPVETFAVLTTRPNEVVAGLHDRMPVIVPPDHAGAWLAPVALDQELATSLAIPHDARGMVAWPVTSRVGNPGYDAPDCIVRQFV